MNSDTAAVDPAALEGMCSDSVATCVGHTTSPASKITCHSDRVAAETATCVEAGVITITATSALTAGEVAAVTYRVTIICAAPGVAAPSIPVVVAEGTHTMIGAATMKTGAITRETVTVTTSENVLVATAERRTQCGRFAAFPFV